MVLTAWVFSRWMALIYLAAFWSLGVQVLGLIGHQGVLPIGDFLRSVQGEAGGGRFWLVPTLCWLNHSDWFLLFLCWGGAALSILLLFGIMPGLSAFLLWLFYLSLTVAGQDFLGFQWDNLLLEAGFLLIFLFPRPLGIQLKPSVRPSIIVIWLLRWLLFRLMFESGVVKLASGDPHWADLTALTYHYWTQPLPNVISWYMAQLPLWFEKLSCLFVFIIELVVPFFIFFGRRARLIAFWGIVVLQSLIMLTGNYCFFNLLAIGLCLLLLDDGHLKFIPLAGAKVIEGGAIHKVVTCLVAALILTVSLGLIANSFAGMALPLPVEKLVDALSPLRSINNYGLFAVMTTRRNEIILEGSNDGSHWKPYEFPYKPGNIYRAPGWAVPYQPRLDWQMWFASLSNWRQNPWLINLMRCLLKGDPSVLRLFAKDPFAGHPPRYIQATFWEYHFTGFKARKATGAWWQREIKGLYCPTLSW
ncbi:MAG: lipase maturation factor family protein [Candidatus Omnitrophica bacterium]|nr:lipase maturation factor family protein [Candidatus Omnitrophota bacterium]MDE2008786.1 lipase maturation factor family protein [Candidatus Omnitrophota bacterium]MDE2213651.1 lipase maturation factor family protein [Candidatus Omnitrophota bacterium]MDE2230448.1 lipase maturation factor family protein [Candidatus Omnitrophota bacterium]